MLSLDARTGKEVARHAETTPRTAQVLGIEVSRKGNLLAIAVDAGHQAFVRLLDAARWRSAAPWRCRPVTAGWASSRATASV